MKADCSLINRYQYCFLSWLYRIHHVSNSKSAHACLWSFGLRVEAFISQWGTVCRKTHRIQARWWAPSWFLCCIRNSPRFDCISQIIAVIKLLQHTADPRIAMPYHLWPIQLYLRAEYVFGWTGFSGLYTRARSCSVWCKGWQSIYIKSDHLLDYVLFVIHNPSFNAVRLLYLSTQLFFFLHWSSCRGLDFMYLKV